MSILTAEVNLERFGPSIDGAWNWWRDSMLLLMPEQLRLRGSKRENTLRLRIEPDRVHVEYGSEGIQFDVEQPCRSRVILDALVESGISAAMVDQVELAADPSLAFVRTIELPKAAMENLREVVSFELDRFTPLAADALYFDYRTLDPQSDDMLSLRLFAIPRRLLDPLREELDASGFVVTRIAVERAGSAPEINLLPPRVLRPFARARAAARRYGLVTLLAGLIVTVFWVPVVKKQAALAGLEGRQAALQQAVAPVAEKRAELIEAIDSDGFIGSQRRSAPTLTEVLNELTVRLSDEHWVDRVTVSSATVTVSGYSSEVSNIPPELEQSSLFDGARFTTAVSREPAGTIDRFTVAVTLAQDPP